jgi:hypothetical protein
MERSVEAPTKGALPMIRETRFTEREIRLLVSILDSEARKLRPEIRHTDARAMRDDLRDRLRDVERLGERLRAELPPAAPEPIRVELVRGALQL